MRRIHALLRQRGGRRKVTPSAVIDQTRVHSRRTTPNRTNHGWSLAWLSGKRYIAEERRQTTQRVSGPQPCEPYHARKQSVNTRLKKRSNITAGGSGRRTRQTQHNRSACFSRQIQIAFGMSERDER